MIGDQALDKEGGKESRCSTIAVRDADSNFLFLLADSI